MKEKKKRWLAGAAVLALSVFVFCFWQNNALTVSRFQVSGNRIPKEFDGFTIVQISDLHNKEFGREQQRIVSKLEEVKPDLLVITGDMIDSRRTNVNAALDFAEKAAELAPCFYVSGNHESRMPEDYVALKTGLEQLGAEVLENEVVKINRKDAWISLMGVQDPAFSAPDAGCGEKEIMMQQLRELEAEAEGYRILLSHRPEFLDVYAEKGVNLVFSGHAHGGQWRIPGIGGLIAPGQGVFPKYTSGLYTLGNTVMCVSRGLGNSLMPIRIFNRPEIVIVELRCELG